jgi:hypothetical protein
LFFLLCTEKKSNIIQQSTQNHVFKVLFINERLRIYSEQSVPPFGPSLPTPPVFTNHKEFREFLLVKRKKNTICAVIDHRKFLKTCIFSVINGEKSAFNNSVFGKRRKRTIEAILTSLYTSYEKDNAKVIKNF